MAIVILIIVVQSCIGVLTVTTWQLKHRNRFQSWKSVFLALFIVLLLQIVLFKVLKKVQ